MGHSRPLFIYFRLFNTVDNKQMLNKFCQWLESNRGPLVLKATALPTEPQPLPWNNFLQRQVSTQNGQNCCHERRTDLRAGTDTIKLFWLKVQCGQMLEQKVAQLPSKIVQKVATEVVSSKVIFSKYPKSTNILATLKGYCPHWVCNWWSHFYIDILTTMSSCFWRGKLNQH